MATPPLADPNFDRTVVYMLSHHDEGAFGVVLNRPTMHDLPDGVASWEPHLSDPPVLFEGGPVSLSGLIALAMVQDADDEVWSTVVGGLRSVDLALNPTEVGGDVQQLRVFRGYSGWGPQQLEGELAEGAWMVLSAEPGDVFTNEPDELWRAVIRRQGGRVAWMANAPDDLSSN